jgi:hypothetical protein
MAAIDFDVSTTLDDLHDREHPFPGRMHPVSIK